METLTKKTSNKDNDYGVVFILIAIAIGIIGLICFSFVQLYQDRSEADKFCQSIGMGYDPDIDAQGCYTNSDGIIYIIQIAKSAGEYATVWPQKYNLTP